MFIFVCFSVLNLKNEKMNTGLFQYVTLIFFQVTLYFKSSRLLIQALPKFFGVIVLQCKKGDAIPCRFHFCKSNACQLPACLVPAAAYIPVCLHAYSGRPAWRQDWIARISAKCHGQNQQQLESNSKKNRSCPIVLYLPYLIIWAQGLSEGHPTAISSMY